MPAESLRPVGACAVRGGVGGAPPTGAFAPGVQVDRIDIGGEPDVRGNGSAEYGQDGLFPFGTLHRCSPSFSLRSGFLHRHRRSFATRAIGSGADSPSRGHGPKLLCADVALMLIALSVAVESTT
jgi:hypothetical protein